MATAFEPAYHPLLHSGELKRRVAEAYARLEACDICARECGVNRRLSTEGAGCRTGERAIVSSYGPHFGEEAPLVGRGGSGTIFFSWCNLRCQYCQNYEISQGGEGHEVGPEELARMIAENGPLAVQSCKASVLRTSGLPLEFSPSTTTTTGSSVSSAFRVAPSRVPEQLCSGSSEPGTMIPMQYAAISP